MRRKFASMASLAEIDAEANAAVTALKAGNYDEALLRIDCAQVLIATTPDMEMDRQRKEYSDRDKHFDALRKRIEKIQAKSTAGKLASIPVHRKCL